MKRIVFTGDCFRSVNGEPNQWMNVVWLKEQLSGNLEALLGLPSEAILPSPTEAWRTLQLPPSLDSWAHTFWNSASDDLCEFLRPTFQEAFVVAFELSPLLESALNRLEVPWVEVGISPLRFLPDFALFFRFSRGLSVPERFRLSDAEINEAILKVRAFYGAAPVDGTVFFAQTVYDRTQITRSGFVDAIGFIENLPSPLWVKPHPLHPNNPIVERALQNGRLLEHNTYAALSANVTVASISSSVVVEASAFGRPTIVAHSEVLDRNLTGLTTLNGYRHSGFWREALAGIPLSDIEFSGPFLPNALRSGINPYGLDMAIYAKSSLPS